MPSVIARCTVSPVLNHDAVHDVAEFRQPDRRAVAVGDDHVAVFGRVHQLSGRLERERLVRSDDGAGRRVDVPGAQRGLDLVDADLPRRERVRIELRMDGVFLAAEHLHLRDAADHRDALSDARFRVLVQRPGRHRRRRDDEVEHRLVGRVDLGEGRRRRHALGEQTRGLRDRRLHVHGGAVEAAIQVELERDLGGPERVDGRHRLEAGDHRELILERCRHRRAHRFRTGTRQGRRHEERGEVDVWQVADRQRAVRHQTEQGNRRHQQAGRDRPLDEAFRDIHDGFRPFLAGAAGLLGACSCVSDTLRVMLWPVWPSPSTESSAS
jgi:hypothetical protein